MLRSFRVVNHKSIREEQELVLLPAYDKSRPVLPVAGIFGANAAGKSNLFDALRSLQQHVRLSLRSEPGAGTWRAPYRLDSAMLDAPSSYAVELRLRGERYIFGVSVTDEGILEEWLYRYPQDGKQQRVFEREGSTVKLGSTLPEFRSRQRRLSQETRANVSVLAKAADLNYPEVMDVYGWFRAGLRVRRPVGGRTMPSDWIARYFDSAADRAELVSLLRAADLGITDVKPVEVSSESSDELQARLDDLRAELDDADDAARDRILAQIASLDRRVRNARRMRYDLLFFHGDSETPFFITDESDGTRAWLDTVISARGVLDRGGVLCIDEIDSSLHTRLSVQLIRMFQDPELNPNNAQLVFTSHDAALLGTLQGREVLRRDEVWFIEKDESGASRLFPLTNFKPRKEESVSRRYLGGSYGAVPNVSEPDFREALGLDPWGESESHAT